MTTLTLLPGTSLVEIEGAADRYTGPIIIPDSIRKAPSRIGRVIATNLTGKDRAFLGVNDLTGKRVLVAPGLGQQIKGNRYLYHNLHEYKDPQTRRPVRETPFRAILDDETDIKASESTSVKRCRYCGPAKVGGETRNGMMLVPGPGGTPYCPKCKRSEDGGVINPDDLDAAVR